MSEKAEPWWEALNRLPPQADAGDALPLCQKCFRYPAAKGTRCQPCRNKNLKQRKALREKAKAAGLCGACKTRKPETGRKQCQRCSDQKAKRRRQTQNET